MTRRQHGVELAQPSLGLATAIVRCETIRVRRATRAAWLACATLGG